MQTEAVVRSRVPVVHGIAPLISVIIPAYNEAENIAACLTAVLDQDFGLPYEVIVIDGPSTDATSSVAKNFPVRLARLEKRGIGRAWQMGAEYGLADLLVFTEADSVAPRHWLRTIYEQMQSNPKAIGVVGTFMFIGKSKLANFAAQTMTRIIDNLFRTWKGTIPFRGKNFAIRRQALWECGGFDENVDIYGDVELSLRAGKLGKVIYAPDLTVSTSSRDIDGAKNRRKFLRRFSIAMFYLLVKGRRDKLKISLM